MRPTPRTTKRPSAIQARIRRGAVVALLWCAASVLAQSPDLGTSRPEVAALKGVTPTAPARFRVWGFEVYDARLWLTAAFEPVQYSAHAFALELQYLRRLEGATIASSSIGEMRRLGSFSDAQAQSWEAALRAIFPNVGPGERITGVHLPGVGVEFWVNGQRTGAVADPQFARLFFGIWLDERSSQPRLRSQLLQGRLP
jgi:hypothetical protein